MGDNECVVCGASLVMQENLIRGELIECPDCGCELEVSSIDPLQLVEAPTEEEDWGQ